MTIRLKIYQVKRGSGS